MASERKNSELSSRLVAKRAARTAAAKSTRPPNSIVPPPKATVATSHAKPEQVHRHQNLFNDMLVRRGEDDAESKRPKTPQRQPSEDELGQCKSLLHDGAQRAEDATKIAQLERMLIVANQERHSLREELQQLRHQLSENSSMPKVPSQNQDDMQRRRRKLSFEVIRSEQADHSTSQRPGVQEELLQQNEELQYRLALLQDQLENQNHRVHSAASAQSEAQWNELRLRLHAAEKESQERLQQLLSLKASISSLTRMDAQITDGDLADSFLQIANRIREWVVTNLRRSKLVLADISPAVKKVLTTEIGYLPNDCNIDKIAFYQAIIGSAVANILQDLVIYGLPETGPLSAFRECVSTLRTAGSEYNEWRRATIRALDQSKSNENVRSVLKDALHRTVGEIAHLLFSITSISITSQAQLVLTEILSTVATLQRTLVLQKAQYRISFFRTHSSSMAFEKSTMEAVGDIDIDEGDVSYKKFLFCIFPCVEKFGDERGNFIERSNVLLKAKVYCVIE